MGNAAFDVVGIFLIHTAGKHLRIFEANVIVFSQFIEVFPVIYDLFLPTRIHIFDLINTSQHICQPHDRQKYRKYEDETDHEQYNT